MGKIEELVAQGFRFNKALGQNFISDTNLLRAIVADSALNAQDTVVEVGAGAGTLTAEIAKAAGRVVAFEVDKSLIPFLHKELSGFPNIHVQHTDILKASYALLEELTAYGGSSPDNKTGAQGAEGKRFKVVANLPYYITTPVIFYFLESVLAVDSITIMVQEEVARRIVARPKTADYGALTAAVAARCSAKITRLVSRNMFTPRPNVDSAVVNLKVEREYDPVLSKVIKSLFAMRRKTAVNNLTAAGIHKAAVEDVFTELNISLLARGEEFSVDIVREIKNGLLARGVRF